MSESKHLPNFNQKSDVVAVSAVFIVLSSPRCGAEIRYENSFCHTMTRCGINWVFLRKTRCYSDRHFSIYKTGTNNYILQLSIIITVHY